MDEIWRTRWLNRMANVRTAARDADLKLETHGASERTRYTAQLVIEELLSNSIKYAFEDGTDHYVTLTMAMDETTCRITLSDDGRPFDPSCDPKTGICRPVPKPTQGGLGIMMVRQLANTVTYARKNGNNVVQVDLSTTESSAGAPPPAP